MNTEKKKRAKGGGRKPKYISTLKPFKICAPEEAKEAIREFARKESEKYLLKKPQ